MTTTEQEVRELCAGGEGVRTEFKRGLPADWKVARVLAGFANTRGGTLLIGVDDRGRVVGVDRPRAIAAELRRIAEQRVVPALAIVVDQVDVGDARVLTAFLGRSDRAPHAALDDAGEGTVVVRLGSSTRAADRRAIAAMRSSGKRTGLNELERRVLDWLQRQGDAGTHAASTTTVDDFARTANIGRSRARRCFVKLERAGWIVGHGAGAKRSFAPS